MPEDHFRLPPLRTSTEQASQRKLGHIFTVPRRRPRPEETSQDQESKVEDSESEASENEDLEGLRTMMASAQEQLRQTMEQLMPKSRQERKVPKSTEISLDTRAPPNSLSKEAARERKLAQDRLRHARNRAKKEAQAQENCQVQYPTTPPAAVSDPPHTPSPLWKAEYQPSPSIPSQEKPRPDVEPLSPRREDSVMRKLEEP